METAIDRRCRAVIETPSKLTGRLFAEPGAKGAIPGVEIPAIPDVVDVVDANDTLQGLGVHAWRRPRRVRRVV